MTFYALLIIVHVLATIVWIGCGFAIQMIDFSVGQDRALRAAVGPHLGWLGQRIITPASLVVPASGIVLAWMSGMHELLWVKVALGLTFVTLGIGMLVITPSMKRASQLRAAIPPDHATAAALTARAKLAARFNLGLLLVIVCLMILKQPS